MHQLFENIVIPAVVVRELSQPTTPLKVRNWIGDMPTWANIAQSPTTVNPKLAGLDAGETQAIQLALTYGATTLLLIDERKGRRVAKQLSVKVTGTVGILQLPAARNLIQLNEEIVALRKTNFRLSSSIERQALDRT